MTPLRLAVSAALVLAAVFVGGSLMKQSEEPQTAHREAAVEENARAMVEAFYTCPGPGRPAAMRKRNATLRALSVTPPPDPSFFCTKVLQGAPSAAAVTNVRPVGVRDDTAGVTVSLTLDSKAKSESITVDLTLSNATGQWLVAEVA
ncbi:MAG: hypothetical protein L0H93_11260 [Nocardioides sp.]|nr:hypothetical protein [Nocardioides sp.]